MKPNEFERQRRTGIRFGVRLLSGHWQVFHRETLEDICLCLTEEKADMIERALTTIANLEDEEHGKCTF